MEKGGLELVRWTKQHINYIHQFVQREKEIVVYIKPPLILLASKMHVFIAIIIDDKGVVQKI
jgi:hypothetical protein